QDQQAATQTQHDQRRRSAQTLVQRRDRRFSRRSLGRIGRPALGIAHGQPQQRRDQNAGQADRNEGRSPAVLGRQQAADQRSRRRAQRNAEGEAGHGARPLMRWEIVGDQ